MHARNHIAVGLGLGVAAALFTLFLIYGARTADAQGPPPDLPPSSPPVAPDPLAAQLPPPLPDARNMATMSIEELAQQLLEIRHQRADLEKAEKALIERLKARIRQQNEILRGLGVLEDNVPVPVPVEVPGVNLPRPAEPEATRATLQKK